MDNPIRIIYKYTSFKQAVEENNTLSNYINPHANMEQSFLHELARIVTTQPSIREKKLFQYWYSRFSNNKLIRFIIARNIPINIDGLIQSKNWTIEPLLEKHKDQLEITHWTTMTTSQNSTILRFIKKNIEFLRKYGMRIFWPPLSTNESPDAIQILKENPDLINWIFLSGNPSAIDILEENLDKINWDELCKNRNAIRLIEQNVDLINFKNLSSNPNAIHILLQNLDKIDFEKLAENPNAMEIMSIHQEFFDLHFNSFLKHPGAIPFIEMRMDRLGMEEVQLLAQNPNGLSLIHQLLDIGRITQSGLIHLARGPLLRNEAVFELDYKKMAKARSRIIYEDLIMETLKPERVKLWLDYFCDGDDNKACEFDWFSVN
jgi:hypothetical protein